jgi:DNA-binding PadR family transcriptional regulator
MNPARLLILGSLARKGPMHGHQIRRDAQTDRTELWTDVKVGSLYGALSRMAAEGVIEPVRTERDGNMPTRTIYMITAAGRQELEILRAAALRDVRLRPDPVDLALHYSEEAGVQELLSAFADRHLALKAELESWRHLRDTASAHLTGVEPLVLEHQILRLEAELAWHDLVQAELPTLLGADPGPPRQQETE